jgi:hypothetical protein
MKTVVDVVAAFLLIILMVVVSAVLFIGGLVIMIIELAVGLVKAAFRGIKHILNKSKGGNDFATA